MQQDNCDAGAELERLRNRLTGSAGAIVSFIGLVRDLNGGDAITGMTLEHYPGMTEKVTEVHGREPALLASRGYWTRYSGDVGEQPLN